MTPYGYRDQRTRCIFGPEQFEMPTTSEQLTAIYLEPTYKGQPSFACTLKDVGIFFYNIECIDKYRDLVPLYEGVQQ